MQILKRRTLLFKLPCTKLFYSANAHGFPYTAFKCKACFALLQLILKVYAHEKLLDDKDSMQL